MKKKVELLDVDPVTIKPLFGMKPGMWLTYLYILIIILVIFLVGFLPGILNGRKRVTFTSPAGHCAVYLDGKYIGGTPFTTYVSSGEHKVEFKIYGNTIETASMKVGHPVFLTWVFPRKMNFDGKEGIDQSLKETIIRQFLSDVEMQNAVTAYDDRHHYPPLFSNLASFNLGTDMDAMQLAWAHITSSEMLDDAITAASDMGIDESFALQKTLFSDDRNQSLIDSFKGNQVKQDSTITLDSASLDAGLFSLEGRTVSTGKFSMGQVQNELNYQDAISAMVTETIDQSFAISTTEITEYQYALFLSENPKWNDKAALMENGLVDQYYLSGVSTSLVFPSNKSIRNISFNAAKAFCMWLSEKTGQNVFIPSEVQWSAASSALESISFQKSLVAIDRSEEIASMLGGVWEFTDTCFVPLGRAIEVLDADLHKKLTYSLSRFDLKSDVIIKGGSYLDSASTISTATVGVISRDECSETVGFRVAWN